MVPLTNDIRTLKLIYEFMRTLADSKWSDRFLRKNSIEDALAGYTRLMDEAAQSFQVGLVLSWINLVLIVTMQLATLIDLHYTVGTFSRNNTENIEIQAAAQPHIEAPPPYKKKKTLEMSVQELEIAESSVTTVIDVPELTRSSSELSLSLQSEEPLTEIATDGIRDYLNDHYLPEQLSSLTLDNDHGVPLKGFCTLSHLTYFSSFGDTINPRSSYGVDRASRKVGGREEWRYKYRDNLPSSRDMMIQRPKHPG